MARTYNTLFLIMPVENKKKEQDNEEIKRLNTWVFTEKKYSLEKEVLLWTCQEKQMKTTSIWIWEKEQCWHGDQTGGSQKYLVFNFTQLF